MSAQNICKLFVTFYFYLKHYNLTILYVRFKETYNETLCASEHFPSVTYQDLFTESSGSGSESESEPGDLILMNNIICMGNGND